MQTYQFTAFQNQRYAANGEVKADSPEEAQAKIMQRYNSLWQGLDFDDYVGDEAPDHIILTDEAGEVHHLEDETPPDVLKALTALIEKADNLIAAIDLSSVALAKVDGTTGQFEAEVSALSGATSAAEKAMRAAGGVS
jgi:hypothetical protein